MARVDDIYPPGRVSLREVGLRDGLQMVKKFPTTAGKLAWIEMEFAAGMRHFEVGTFLPRDRYPAFADIDTVITAASRFPGLHAAALVPNLRGAEDALASGVAEINCVISASEAHNQANLQRSQTQTLSEIEAVCELRDASKHKPLIGVGIAMSFGCSISGKVAPDEVLRIAEKCFGLGADIVSIADTVGFAGPKQVDHLSARMRKLAGERPYGVHLHDTRGLGMANAAAALEQGARVLDASLGGLGGCPFAPDATGNIVMEDLVFLCQSSGFDVGVDLGKLIRVRDVLSREMPEEILYGALAKAGFPRATGKAESTV